MTKISFPNITALSHKQTIMMLLAVGILIVFFGWLSVVLRPFYLFGGLGVVALTLLIFAKPWHGLLLFVFFIPFEHIGSYDFYGVTIRPSQVTILLVMVVWFFTALQQRRLRLPQFPIGLPLAIFLIVALLGLLNAPNLNRSVLVLIFIIFTFAVGLIIPIFVCAKKDVSMLLKFLFASMLFVTVFGLFQFGGDLAGLPPAITGLRELYTKDVLGFPRVQSTSLEPLYFANYLLIPLGVLLALFLRQDKSIKMYYIVGLLALGSVNLVLTVARGGYIAFLVTALVVMLCNLPRVFSLRNVMYFTVPLAVGLIIVWQILDMETITAQLIDFSTHIGNLFSGASYVERVETFTMARQIWLEHPLIGLGPGSFGPYVSFHPLVIPEHGWKIVNNVFLELLAEHGVLGFTAMMSVYFILIVRSIKAIWRATDPYIKTVLVGFFAAFVGILVQYNTFSILYIVQIWFTIGMLIALQNIVLHPQIK